MEHFGATWKHFGVTWRSLWDTFGSLWSTLGSLQGHFGTLVVYFGVTFGCMRAALVSLLPIFGKHSFSKWILMILYRCLLNLALLGGHFGVTLEHFGVILVPLRGDFGHIAVEWQV